KPGSPAARSASSRLNSLAAGLASVALATGHSHPHFPGPALPPQAYCSPSSKIKPGLRFTDLNVPAPLAAGVLCPLDAVLWVCCLYSASQPAPTPWVVVVRSGVEPPTFRFSGCGITVQDWPRRSLCLLSTPVV